MLVMIVPSRGRPTEVAAMMSAVADTSTVADTQILWAVDADDPLLPDYGTAVTAVGDGQRCRLMVTPRTGSMVGALNSAAVQLSGDPAVEAIGFLGDDHRPRTRGWDAAFLSALREPGVGLVYADDLYSSDFVPTHVAMRSAIVATLGWMAHPALRHMYVDTLWRDMGNAAGPGVLRYLKHPDPSKTVVVEHMHYGCGKAVEDAGYRRVNAPEVYAADEQAYTRLRDTGEVTYAGHVIAELVGGGQ